MIRQDENLSQASCQVSMLFSKLSIGKSDIHIEEKRIDFDGQSQENGGDE